MLFFLLIAGDALRRLLRGVTKVLGEEHLSRAVSRHFEEGILGLELLFLRGKKGATNFLC